MKPIEQWLGRENQMQLSRRFGVSQPVISQWVRNVVRVP